MAEDIQKPAPDAVAQVVAELKSGFYYGGGPKKQLLGVTMAMATSAPAENDITALIDITAYEESPWGDSANTQRSFRLSLAEVKVLSETAPLFNGAFFEIALKMTEQLERERAPFLLEQAACEAAQRAEQARQVEEWCDQGLPTSAPTSVRTPLRLQRKNKFGVAYGD